MRRPREKTPDNCQREPLNNVNNGDDEDDDDDDEDDDDDAFKIYADTVRVAFIKNMALSNPIPCLILSP